MRFLFNILGLWICLFVFAAGQSYADARSILSTSDTVLTTQDTPLFGQPLSAIKIQAPERLRESAKLHTQNLKFGSALNRRELRRAVMRLYLLPRIADVQVWAKATQRGVALRIVLSPASVLTSVEVKGAIKLNKQIVIEQLNLKIGEVIDDLDLAALKSKLRNFYRDAGFARALVKLKLLSVNKDGGHSLQIDIHEGPASLVRSLQIRADSPDARRDLRDWSHLYRGQRYDQSSLRTNLKQLRQHDLQRGFLAAKLATIQQHRYDKRQLDVELQYQRGPKYLIHFAGVQTRSAANLRELLKSDHAHELGAKLFANYQEVLKQAYAQWGYPKAKISIHDREGETSQQRILVIQVNEGPRVVLRNIVIDGASKELAQDLIDLARQTVADALVEQSAFNPVDPGDIETLLKGSIPGQVQPEGIEYPMAWRDLVDPYAVYDAKAYRLAVSVMEDYCRSHGYLKAKLQVPKAHWFANGRQLDLHYKIDMGTQTRIDSLRFSGNLAFAAASLLELLTIKPGDALDLSKIEQARLYVLRNYANAGYAFAGVQTAIGISEDHQKANIAFVINEGPLVHIARILLRGQRQTRQAVLFDRLLLKEGDLYSAEAVKKSRQRLLALGLFSSVQINMVDAERPEAIKDLRVDVKERRARVFETHVGASVEDGPRAEILLEHRNLFGLGLAARSKLKINYPRLTYFTIADEALRQHMEQRFLLEYPGLDNSWREMMFTEGQALMSLEYPKIFSMPIDTSAHGTLLAMRENRSAFTLNKVALQLGMDLQPLKNLHLGDSIEFAGTDFLCYSEVGGPYRTCGNDNTGLTRRQDTGQLGHVTLRQEITLDGRDNPFRPHMGFYVAAAGDLAFGGGLLYGDSGIGPGRVTTPVTSNFFKLSTSVSGYLPLTKTWTLAMQARLGNIYAMGDQEHIPLYKKFFLGGTSSIRGFDEDHVLPDDEVRDIESKYASGAYDGDTAQRLLQGSSSGGRFFWNLRSELRFPMSRSVDLGLFIDAGELLETVYSLDITRFSAGSGIGVRWNTPVGPIALDLGVAMKDPSLTLREALTPQQGLAEFQDRYKLHLSIGYY